MPAAIAALLPSLVWTLIGAVLLTLGDLAIRAYFEKTLPLGFILAFGAYALGALFMMMSFFNENIPVASVLIALTNIIAYIVIAHLMYGDTLSPLQITGIALGLIAVIVLELS